VSTDNTNGWSEAELYVREELKRLGGEIAGLRTDVTNLRVDGAHKGDIAGAISGALIAAAGHFLKGKA
jgi:hypothetical protein